MDIAVRELTADDAEQARGLGAGIFRSPPPELGVQDGLTWFGAFDGSTLVAQAIDREYDSWFGGAAIPTSGIAYVGVDEAYRGRGLVRRVVDAAVSAAADRRGALISTLFPAAPRVYRGLGYERITDRIFVNLPSDALAGITTAISTRPATPADLPAIREVYDVWARAQNGPLTRSGPLFAGLDVFEELEAILAIDASGRVVGYASYRRDSPEALHVMDLIAVDGDAHRALLASLSGAGAITLRTSGDDPVRLMLPTSDWQIASSTPYMLRVLDVDAALSRRAYPPGISTELTFAVGDQGHRLTVHDGVGRCESVGIGAHIFTQQALASMYAGAQSCANLRFTGNLNGGDRDEDPVWDALFGGRQPHIRDYF